MYQQAWCRQVETHPILCTGRELLTFTTYLIHLIVYVMLLSSLHIRVTNLINVSNRISVKVEILIWLLKLKRASIVVQSVSF